MTWTMPTRAEQKKMLRDQKIEVGELVAYRSGKVAWRVQSIVEHSPTGSLYAILKSENSGTTRTAWPWELVRVF